MGGGRGAGGRGNACPYHFTWLEEFALMRKRSIAFIRFSETYVQQRCLKSTPSLDKISVLGKSSKGTS